MFRNYVVLEKDLEQVNFIKIRIQGIWNCPNQDQEVGAKHINETKMFQMSCREPMEPIDKEARDLIDLEDVLESEHCNESTYHTEDVNDENIEQISDHIEPPLPDLLLD